MKVETNSLVFKRLGIHTLNEHFVYMREDCHICRSEGFESLTRIQVSNGTKTIVANLNIIRTELIKTWEISLSESAIKVLNVKEGDTLYPSHLHSINSLSFVRSKIYGNELSASELEKIIKDIVAGNYSNVHLSAFITACAGTRLNSQEIIGLTQAMINSGQKLNWNKKIVVDKHCVGGLPGNRTSPIVVSIVTALGLTMPKTSSRAITSPSGTADTMEVMTNVSLSAEEIKKVIEKEGGCIVWGGTAQLSPADDMLIRIEKALDVDSEGQLIASVLSKKVAAGSTHVIIDMPVGETAKLRTIEAANKLKLAMKKVAHAIGLKIKVLITDGSKPVGRGIGPMLEARDLLSVLRNEKNAPQDLKTRSAFIAGELLELSGKATESGGYDMALSVLESGEAYKKFLAICEAQGGFTEPIIKSLTQVIVAKANGIVVNIDNRKLAKIAKLAGAPQNKSAGIDFFAPIGSEIVKGQTLYVIHAESKGELDYALEYYTYQTDIISIE